MDYIRLINIWNDLSYSDVVKFIVSVIKVVITLSDIVDYFYFDIMTM